MLENLKTRPPIVTEVILKKQIAERLAKELRVNEEFMDLHSELFVSYANISLALLEYQSVIPYKDLEKYNKLQYQEAKLYLQIKEKIGLPMLDLDSDSNDLEFKVVPFEKFIKSLDELGA